MEQKRRLFIAIHYMEIGGAEISLIGLLQSLDYTRYDVDLMVYSHRGELMKFIPPQVHLLPEIPAYAYIERPMVSALKAGQWGVVWGRLKARWQYRNYCKRKHPRDCGAVFQYVFSAVEPYLPSLRRLGTYDLAISFLTPHNIVLRKVDARRKACWIHTDYTYVDTDVDFELPIWRGFDHIVSISPAVTQAFGSVFPTLKDKIVEMENILSTRFVRERAALIPESDILREMPRRADEVRILSIGRFSEAKNYDSVPDICRRVNEALRGKKVVTWYIIGYGGCEALIRERIAEAGMEERVILLGKRDNPYPYIKACDVYAQPSRFEGKSVTVREAQILCKPVVTTNYTTAPSQIQDGVDGVIVPMDNAACAEGIARFILQTDKQNQISDYLQHHDYGNEAEVRKLDMMF